MLGCPDYLPTEGQFRRVGPSSPDMDQLTCSSFGELGAINRASTTLKLMPMELRPPLLLGHINCLFSQKDY